MQQYGYWFFPNVYDKNTIKEINILLKNNILSGADNPAVDVVKTSKVSFIPWSSVYSQLLLIEDCIRFANRKNFVYDILPFDYSTILHYNVYEKGNEYQWHQDGMTTEDATDIKLTVILNLSEKPYEGGELMLRINNTDEVVDLKPGSIVVFKSWLSHKVTSVTKGERISLTTWAEGPKFR